LQLVEAQISFDRGDQLVNVVGIGGAEGAAVGGVEAAADDEDVTTGQLESADVANYALTASAISMERGK